jgi:hypothetical protein
LIVCIFLNKTPGARAIPQAERLLERYPTPQQLANADLDDVTHYFKSLGLPGRAKWLIALAKTWCEDPPRPARLHQKLYRGEIQFESEVAYLKGVGRYANDAWRIFCKDKLYGREDPCDPEWKRVRPIDRELSAFIAWKWKRQEHLRNTNRLPQSSTVMDNLASTLGDLEITTDPPLIPVFPDYSIQIPQEVLDEAEVLEPGRKPSGRCGKTLTIG